MLELATAIVTGGDAMLESNLPVFLPNKDGEEMVSARSADRDLTASDMANAIQILTAQRAGDEDLAVDLIGEHRDPRHLAAALLALLDVMTDLVEGVLDSDDPVEVVSSVIQAFALDVELARQHEENDEQQSSQDQPHVAEGPPRWLPGGDVDPGGAPAWPHPSAGH